MEKKGLLKSITNFVSTVWHLPEILHARKEQQKRDSAEAWRIAGERGWAQFLGTPYSELNRVNEQAILIAAETGKLPRFNNTIFKPLGMAAVVPTDENPFVEVSRRKHAAASPGDSATQGR